MVFLTSVLEVRFPRRQTLKFCDLHASNLLGSELRNNTGGGMRKTGLGRGRSQTVMNLQQSPHPNPRKALKQAEPLRAMLD